MSADRTVKDDTDRINVDRIRAEFFVLRAFNIACVLHFLNVYIWLHP